MNDTHRHLLRAARVCALIVAGVAVTLIARARWGAAGADLIVAGVFLAVIDECEIRWARARS